MESVKKIGEQGRLLVSHMVVGYEARVVCILTDKKVTQIEIGHKTTKKHIKKLRKRISGLFGGGGGGGSREEFLFHTNTQTPHPEPQQTEKPKKAESERQNNEF